MTPPVLLMDYNGSLKLDSVESAVIRKILILIIAKEL